jgi:hypothetical protein
LSANNKSVTLLALFFISTTMSDVRVINEYANLSTLSCAVIFLLHMKTILNKRSRLFDLIYILLILIAAVSAGLNQSGNKTINHLIAYTCSICFFGIFIGRIFSVYSIEQLKSAAKYALHVIALCVVLEVGCEYYFKIPPILPRVQDFIYDPPLILFGVELVRARGGMVESGHLALACVGLFAIVKAFPGLPNKSISTTASILIIVLFTNSVAAMISLFVIVIFYINTRVRHLLILFFTLIVPFYLFIPSVISKFSDPSYFDRLNRIIIAYDVLEKNPQYLLLGIGPGNAPLWGIEGSIVSFLILLVFEYGFLSLFALMTLILVLSNKINNKNQKRYLIMVVFLFILQSLSISNFWYTSFWILPSLLYYISVRYANIKVDSQNPIH